MKKIPQTILDIMTADFYLNKEDGTLTILHDRAFDTELLSFDYNPQDGNLIFKFENGQMPFGIELLGEFSDVLQKAATITVIQMDMKTKNPVLGMEIPVTLKQ